MSSRVALVLGFAALAVACGGDSRSEGTRNGAGRGGSGGVSGTSGTGGAGTAGMGGTMPMIGPNCPDEEPEVDAPCDLFGACAYDVCSDGHVKALACDGGRWHLMRACGPLDCPAERPEFLSDCAPLEGLQCRYVEDCCGDGVGPDTQTVIASCSQGRWMLSPASSGEGCAFCAFQHVEGAVCDLPAECVNSGCYSISCYAEPFVQDCVDGAWRLRTLCSK